MKVADLYVGFEFSLLMPEGDTVAFKVRRVSYRAVETQLFEVSHKELFEAGILTEHPHGYSDMRSAGEPGWYDEYMKDRAEDEAWEKARRWNPGGFNHIPSGGFGLPV